MSYIRLAIIGLIIAIATLVAGNLTYCQSLADSTLSLERFNFGFDFGRFRAQDNFVLLELYYSIYRDHLKFVPDGKTWKAEFSFQAEIWQRDSLLASDTWQSITRIDSLAELTSNQKLFGLGYFAIKPGNYQLKVRLRDENSQLQREKQLPLTIESFDTGTLNLSDIELATQIRPNTERNLFYKNGYQVIPNPDQFYGTGLPMLMFYTEIYNLAEWSGNDTSNYSVQYRIIDGDGQVVREFPARLKKKPGESAVEVSGMNIISFQSGTYFFELEAKDLSTGAAIAKRKKFFIYREGDLAVSDSVAKHRAEEKFQAAMERIYKGMSTQTLDEEFDAASYIATREEKEIYKTLDAQGKQAFLIEFWRKRDKSPETPQNEFRDDYLKLVNTANKEFSGFKKGYKSDRGRVLLLYGVPDEIERFPLNMEHKEHHIWKYFSIQGGVIFVFVDKQGFGNLELVHSTARGELSDPDWERWIDPNR
ncbi:MAG: GWxTD domain-containing protein [candidate division KSB1 bacterium]|nr:GWxTD domain-containing protein [candidate division KSB1 bacterium]MDZ7333558.1 GWxTD domain-containing protein [candidate division KSB1 bacterium]MDZ7357003.1 GWxTD domain-containing protein [candidate division KSB1 bacterium]MDZ7375229.1 GWxTD domain-containing protein [candidate division KSB1 bacterium]MDZ7398672.1 GWxTD domain-containing protein [candidate division KSB1 bacterium]